MYCPKCGAKNDDDSLFCAKCGGRLSQTDVKDVSDAAGSAESVGSEEFEDTIIMKPVKPTGEFVRKDTPKADITPPNTVHRTRPAPRAAVRTEEYEQAKNDGSNKAKATIIVLSCCLAVLLIVFGIVAFRLSASQNKLKSDLDKVQQSESEKKNDKKTDKKTETDKKTDDTSEESTDEKPSENVNQNFSTIPVDMAYSSSERSDGGYTFNSSFAVDSKLSTAWSPATNGGVGECITLCFSTERTVHGIKISNGYSKSDEDYLSNARLKGFTVKFPSGSTFSSALADNTTALQDVRFKDAVDCQSLTVYVDSVYAGGEDGTAPLCISEIEVY